MVLQDDPTTTFFMFFFELRSFSFNFGLEKMLVCWNPLRKHRNGATPPSPCSIPRRCVGLLGANWSCFQSQSPKMLEVCFNRKIVWCWEINPFFFKVELSSPFDVQIALQAFSQLGVGGTELEAVNEREGVYSVSWASEFSRGINLAKEPSKKEPCVTELGFFHIFCGKKESWLDKGPRRKWAKSKNRKWAKKKKVSEPTSYDKLTSELNPNSWPIDKNGCPYKLTFRSECGGLDLLNHLFQCGELHDQPPGMDG